MISDLGKKLHYRFFLSRKGFGKPLAKEKFDTEYRTGSWDFLNTIDEMANYMVVVGYVRYFAKSIKKTAPRVLDLGCGTGNLAELFGAYPLENYLGLDLSGEAVNQANRRNLPNAEFAAADFEDFRPDGKFDFIISTGAIHYARNPAELLKKYSKILNDDGKFVVSLWRHPSNKGIWRKIEKHFEIIDSTVVTNRKGVVWDVKVFR